VNRTMYDISKELDIARDEAYLYAEEHDGELPDYINTYLDNLEGEYEDKAVNIACVIKDLVSFSDNIATEQKRLKKLKVQTENEIERIKEYLSTFMTPGDKIKTERATISWRNSTSVVLNVDKKDLPEEFQNITIEASKSAIKNAIKNGDDVSDYASLKTINRIQVK